MTTASNNPVVSPAARKEARVKTLTSGLSGLYKGWRTRLGRGGAKKDMVQRFKEWLVGARLTGREELYTNLPAQAQSFLTWLTEGVSASESKTFTQQVAAFCGTMHFNLEWLTDPDLAKDPQLAQALGDAVTLYSLASWKANQAQADIKVFAAWKAWQQDPLGKEQRDLTQKLFARLVEQNLSSPPSPQLFLAGEKDRLAYAVQAIRQVGDSNMPAIKAILKEL